MSPDSTSPRPVRRAGRSSVLYAGPASERLRALSTRTATAADGKLSPVQALIVGLVAEGFTDARIAGEMRWTEASVSEELARARARLGALNRAHVVAIAIRNKLIP